LHLYIYNIVQVRFYNPSGVILYSFNPEQLGQHSPEGPLSDELADALANKVISRQSHLPANDNYTGHPITNALELYVPVVRDARVIGVAEVYRDIGPLLNDIRTMQFAVTLVVFARAVVVFLALRGVFSSSTREIMART